MCAQLTFDQNQQAIEADSPRNQNFLEAKDSPFKRKHFETIASNHLDITSATRPQTDPLA
jgi:hypothetical protein